MKRIAVILMLLVFVSATAFADAADPGKSLSVRTFQFKHKQADKAAAIIKSLLTASGSMSIQPATNSLVVTDDPEKLKEITAALATFDAAPQPFHLTVRLISAGRTGAKGQHFPDALRDLQSKLALLRYDTVESLGSADVDGKEGEPGIVTLASYRADFKFGEYDPASDTIAIADFQLSRLTGDQLSSMMKTTLNLKLGQTFIMGITRQPDSGRALMMVLSARR
ncbi:MAG TPA: secretin N-terminal domain-containing protein [Thermoanaerobaculia bacterium]